MEFFRCSLMASTFVLQPMDKQLLYSVRLKAVFVLWSNIIHKVRRLTLLNKVYLYWTALLVFDFSS